MAATKWLSLVDDNGYTKEMLTRLVASYGTDGWHDEFGVVISDAYSSVIGDLDLDKTTSAMLAEKFRAFGAEGQVLQKCITFYLAAMRNVGWQISPHLSEKALRQRGERRRSKQPEHGVEGETRPGGPSSLWDGQVQFPHTRQSYSDNDLAGRPDLRRLGDGQQHGRRLHLATTEEVMEALAPQRRAITLCGL